jgi:RNA polymerase sigma-70 factor (ECF subfamily)
MRLDEIVEDQAWLRKLAVSLAGDAARADDLVQDTLETAVRRPPEKPGKIRPWLAGVLRNRWRMTARANARETAREERAADPLVEDQTPDALVERAELYAALCRLVSELAEPYRHALLLRYAPRWTGQKRPVVDGSKPAS